jgi:hypothetical protein
MMAARATMKRLLITVTDEKVSFAESIHANAIDELRNVFADNQLIRK